MVQPFMAARRRDDAPTRTIARCPGTNDVLAMHRPKLPPFSPIDAAAADHELSHVPRPDTCTHTHARRSMAPRVPVLLAPAIALPTTQALVVRRLAKWPCRGSRQTRPVSHRTHSGRPSALAFRGHRSPRCQLSKPLAVLHLTQARRHDRLRRHDHGHLHTPPHGPVQPRNHIKLSA